MPRWDTCASIVCVCPNPCFVPLQCISLELKIRKGASCWNFSKTSDQKPKKAQGVQNDSTKNLFQVRTSNGKSKHEKSSDEIHCNLLFTGRTDLYVQNLALSRVDILFANSDVKKTMLRYVI